MYYFGTNLDDRFHISGFWPSEEQSHKIPLDKEEIDNEIARMRKMDALRRERRKLEMEAQAQGQVQQAAEWMKSILFNQWMGGSSRSILRSIVLLIIREPV